MREVEFRLPFTMLKGRVPHERSQRVAPAESNAVERVDKLRKQRRAKHIDMATDYGRNNNVACSRDATSDDSCQRLGAVLPSGTSVQELAEAAVCRRVAAGAAALLVVVGAVMPPVDVHRRQAVTEFDAPAHTAFSPP